jgi:hypothetical protein
MLWRLFQGKAFCPSRHGCLDEISVKTGDVHENLRFHGNFVVRNQFNFIKTKETQNNCAFEISPFSLGSRKSWLRRIGPHVALRNDCATLKSMQTRSAYFFYFWFSPSAAER